jgi:hypothetical protein
MAMRNIPLPTDRRTSSCKWAAVEICRCFSTMIAVGISLKRYLLEAKALGY